MSRAKPQSRKERSGKFSDRIYMINKIGEGKRGESFSGQRRRKERMESVIARLVLGGGGLGNRSSLLCRCLWIGRSRCCGRL